MSERYIRTHFEDIKRYANAIEDRMDDEYCMLENVLEDNALVLKLAQKSEVNYILIDDEYKINIDF